MGSTFDPPSGVTAEDMVVAPSIGDLNPQAHHMVETGVVGDRWIDQGQVCDGKGKQVPGCFSTTPYATGSSST